jgi:hypothetical protein
MLSLTESTAKPGTYTAWVPSSSKLLTSRILFCLLCTNYLTITLVVFALSMRIRTHPYSRTHTHVDTLPLTCTYLSIWYA